MANLVNSMMQEMQMNNPPQELDYQPQMGGGSHMQPQQHVQMGEPQYMQPQMQMQAPTMQQHQLPPQMMEQPQRMGHPMMGPESPEGPDLDAPDLTDYGMEEETTGSWFDNILQEVKAPIILALIVFCLSLPQVSSVIRNMFSRATSNTLYLNIMQSLFVSILFYILNRLLG